MKYVRDLTNVPYTLPKKTPGEKRSVNLPLVVDPDFKKVIQQVAASESRKYGVKISPATLLFNLSMYGQNDLRTASAELRRAYEKLIKENKHVKHNHSTETQPSTHTSINTP